MSDERFDIVFGGELLAGFAPATVADNLARLFKAAPETVARLLDGGTHTLKRDVDAETAAKYRSAMERAGARAVLRALAPEHAAAAHAAELDLAPPGGELLAAHERRPETVVEVDTSHIRLASAFATTAEEERPLPAAPDTSHISIAAVGADLRPEHEAAAPPPPPDTSAITLAEPGAMLGPHEVAQPIVVPDISHISLAPPGAPLDELRPERRAVTPDISALQLAPPG
jgi:hypothetical protein